MIILRKHWKEMNLTKKWHKIISILPIIELILNIIGWVIAGLLLYYPQYIIGLNVSLLKYNFKFKNNINVNKSGE
jgi:hypothetical protein